MRFKQGVAMAISSLLMILNISILAPVVVSAATPTSPPPPASCDGSLLGFPTWHKYLTKEGSDCIIKFDIQKDFPKILLAIFEIILRIGGLVAVGFIIYGGFRYMLSQGEPDGIKGAQATIVNALIGLVITISATVIVNVVAGSFN